MSGKPARPIGIGSAIGFLGDALSSTAKAVGGLVAEGANQAALSAIIAKAYDAGLEGGPPISFLSRDDRINERVAKAYEAGVRERHLRVGLSVHVTRSDFD